jgi:hypothetical protein
VTFRLCSVVPMPKSRSHVLARTVLAMGVLVAPATAAFADSTSGGGQVTDAWADSDAQSLLAAPQLVNPQTVNLTATTPILHLNNSVDYVVKVTSSALTAGAAIVGGHNVVVQNATLAYQAPAGADSTWRVRGLYLENQTGEMYINGLKMTGPLDDGIQMDERVSGVPVVLQNVNIAFVDGSFDGYHADLLQTWAGPSRLVVNNFTGTSDYQGFFLTPNQLWPTGPKPTYFWLNNVKINDATGNYALWTDGYGAFPIEVHNVQVVAKSANRNAWLWPKPSTGDTTWSNVVAVSS